MDPGALGIIETVKERCRVCYTCVRECPAKAIRIFEGQAAVIAERCIGCGNCVRVCSQGAKKAMSSVGAVAALLEGPDPVAACVAPSFPAEFEPAEAAALPGLLRALGFATVHEVAFGADLVAEAYRRFLAEGASPRAIATSCPAIVGYVERYHPALVSALAPIVSPMVAMARVVKAIHGPDTRIVFLGPCIAKKGEASSRCLEGEVDEALTFRELRQFWEERGIALAGAPPAAFDPPHGRYGALFPVSRGLLQAAELEEDLLTGDVVATDGRSNFVPALKEFESGDLDTRLLEVLACQGCIMGAGMTTDLSLFSRRSRVSRHVRRAVRDLDEAEWEGWRRRLAGVDLSRRYEANDCRIPTPSPEGLRAILLRMGKEKPEDELNCGACGYDTCIEHAIAIHKGLAEQDMCLPYTITELHKTVADLDDSRRKLLTTQEALMQLEKLASMGQLAAGIAHEVNNPLGVVLLYAHLLLDEFGSEARLRDDLKLIVEQADRCKKIVAGLLHFARQNRVVRQPVDLVDLLEGASRLLPAPEGVTVRIRRRLENPKAELDRDQMLQVLTNLIGNAYDAMPGGGTLTLTVDGDRERFRLSVEDTGTGIPEENRARIFDPFFTSKAPGKGTGLGLAVTYGIVKMHGGEIAVESNADPARGPTGSTFTISGPRRGGERPV